MSPPPPSEDHQDPLEYDPFLEEAKAREARKRGDFAVDISLDSGEHAQVNEAALQRLPAVAEEAPSGLDAGSLFDDVPAAPVRTDPTKGVAPQAPVRRDSGRLKLDFSEVLGPAISTAGAQRIGGQALEMDQFLSKQEKQAITRAQAVPDWKIASSIDQDIAASPVRVVEERKRIWVWAVVLLVVPAALALGGLYLYSRMKAAEAEQELIELRQAEEIHRKAAEERENLLKH